jgi:RimJ/RimL family protein N-acetyltransferase
MIAIREVTDEDCRLLWEWATDPLVRTWAFRSETIPWEDHVAWFRAKRADPNCYMYVVLDHLGCPIGQVRVDVQPTGEGEVDISIARDRRGRGCGSAALTLACGQMLPSYVKRVVAYIKPGNAASVRSFEKAGFARDGFRRIRGRAAVRMTLQRG